MSGTWRRRARSFKHAGVSAMPETRGLRGRAAPSIPSEDGQSATRRERAEPPSLGRSSRGPSLPSSGGKRARDTGRGVAACSGREVGVGDAARLRIANLTYC